MLHQVIVDTGILIALIDRRDRPEGGNCFASLPYLGNRAVDQMAPPLLTCEAVISETWFLLQRVKNGREMLLQLLEQRHVVVQFDLNAELAAVMVLLARYQSVPVSLADAVLVRMSELYPNSSVFTLDSDFQIYRKHRDRPIALISPQSNA